MARWSTNLQEVAYEILNVKIWPIFTHLLVSVAQYNTEIYYCRPPGFVDYFK